PLHQTTVELIDGAPDRGEGEVLDTHDDGSIARVSSAGTVGAVEIDTLEINALPIEGGQEQRCLHGVRIDHPGRGKLIFSTVDVDAEVGLVQLGVDMRLEHGRHRLERLDGVAHDLEVVVELR